MWSYNCTRVHVGKYVGGGTNEDERTIECNYRVVDGEVLAKKVNPISINGTNSEGTIFTLESFILYPKTETATVMISNGRRKFTIKLVKADAQQGTMFKLKL